MCALLTRPRRRLENAAAFLAWICLAHYRSGGCESCVFHASPRKRDSRSRQKSSSLFSVVSRCNQRINTILLFYVRRANWARWICAPSHAVTCVACKRMHARTHARASHAARFHAHARKTRSNQPPIRLQSMNRDAPAWRGHQTNSSV